MTLSNDLDVDILLLDFEIAVGKTISFFNEIPIENILLSSRLNRVLLNTANMFIALCYLMSEDLADIDEDNIADLEYVYDHGNMIVFYNL